MTNSIFKKATKSQIKIRLALSGASGSGKTFSALSIASHLGSSIALIDTEHGSASRYADKFQFDVCELDNHHPGQYIQAIQAAEQAGYEVIIIDSLSHAWFSELELAGKKFDGWKDVRPLERKLIDAMIGCKAHIIVTMRSKIEYVMEEYTGKDGKTRVAPKKIGTAPVQSSGIEYEFDVAGELNYEHILTISKSRCSELTDRTFLNPGREIAEILKNWMQGTTLETQPAKVFNKQIPPSAAALGVGELLSAAAPETKRLKTVPPPISDSKIQTLRERLVEMKWTGTQFKQCLDINFPGKSSLSELTDRELRDIEDFLNIFETTSLELQRLGWTSEQGKDLLLVHFGKETRSALTFKELAELLKILQSQ